MEKEMKLRLAIYKRALKIIKAAVKEKNTFMIGFCYSMHWARKAYELKFNVPVPKFNSELSAAKSCYPELSAYKPEGDGRCFDKKGRTDADEVHSLIIFWFDTFIDSGIRKRIEILESIIAEMSGKKV